MTTVHFRQRRQAAGSPAIDEISTRWSQIKDPAQFVLRYSPAIRAYLLALLQEPNDADDVSQDFLLHFLQRGLTAATPDRGRFRDYLKVSVRRAALAHLRKSAHRCQADGISAEEAASDESAADDEWRQQWRACLLERALRGIERHVREHPGCGYEVALEIARELPEADSQERARVAGQRLGRCVSAAAFRQMLCRARSLFKAVLIQEVAKTLRDPTTDSIDEELADLELLALVRDDPDR